MQLVPSNSTQSSEALAHKGKVVIHSGPDLRGSKRLRIEELTVVSGVVMPPIQVRDTQEAHGYNPSTDEQVFLHILNSHRLFGIICLSLCAAVYDFLILVFVHLLVLLILFSLISCLVFMKILAWNVQGIGTPLTKNHLKSEIATHLISA